jgi:hypothetical protein
MITSDLSIHQLLVYPKLGDYSNVIRRVDWSIKFTRGASCVVCSGSTVLPTDNLDNFIPIDSVTIPDIQQFIVQATYPEFFENLLNNHIPALDYEDQIAGTVPYPFV